MRLNAGIFPESIEILDRFAERYLQDIPEIDLLGSFNYTEKFMPLRKGLIKVHLECLYPFWTKQPWTLALKGKKVLVVHPFVDTIESQYARRELLFEDTNILPSFELKTLRAVQSNAGNDVIFCDWFEALTYMENEISGIDFDICILGCGAYGLSWLLQLNEWVRKPFIWVAVLSSFLVLKGKDGTMMLIIGKIYHNWKQTIVVFTISIG